MFDEIVGYDTLDADGGPVERYLHLTRGNARLLPERLWDHQTSCRIDGSAHTMRLPLIWYRSGQLGIPQRERIIAEINLCRGIGDRSRHA